MNENKKTGVNYFFGTFDLLGGGFLLVAGVYHTFMLQPTYGWELIVAGLWLIGNGMAHF